MPVQPEMHATVDTGCRRACWAPRPRKLPGSSRCGWTAMPASLRSRLPQSTWHTWSRPRPFTAEPPACMTRRAVSQGRSPQRSRPAPAPRPGANLRRANWRGRRRGHTCLDGHSGPHLAPPRPRVRLCLLPGHLATVRGGRGAGPRPAGCRVAQAQVRTRMHQRLKTATA